MSYLKVVNQNPRTLFGIIHYVKNEAKTTSPLMYGFGLSPEYAFEEMDYIKNLFHKEDGREYKHFIFSFDSNMNLTVNKMMTIGVQIGSYFADGYQILMVLHLNTNNPHIHYVLNTVNMFTGNKFSITKGDFYNYKIYINQILQQYALPLIPLYERKEDDITDEVDSE